MRTEQEMMDLILSTAKEDDRIRSVFLNGSRTNPNAPKDIFQDYDVVYMLRDLNAFLRDSVFSGREWLSRFGEELIFQFPDLNDQVLPLGGGEPQGQKTSFGILMQFMDGNRIDLTLREESTLEAYLKEDKLTLLLLDKDGRAGKLPLPTDEDYHVSRPSRDQYDACCNEFYWVSNYVAKALWRGELTLAHEILDHYVRDMLMEMLNWRVGVERDFAVSTGKGGKYLEKYLPSDVFARVKKTYADGDCDHIWDALEEMQSLFRELAVFVGRRLGYSFLQHWHDNVTRFCRHIRFLPSDAAEIW